MKYFKLITIALILLSKNHIIAQEQKLSSSKSVISWTGKAAFNTYSLTGSLKVKSGNLLIKNDSIKELNVIIDMKSLNHKNKDLKKHLRSKDFFEVKKFTTANFKILKPVIISNGKATLVGYMKIKETKIIETILVDIFHNNEQTKIEFSTTLDRTKYGIKFNSPTFFQKIKQNAIADKFNLKSSLIFN